MIAKDELIIDYFVNWNWQLFVVWFREWRELVIASAAVSGSVFTAQKSYCQH